MDVEILGRRERRRVDAVRLLIDLAVDRRRALGGAARIEGDDVEVLVERGEQVGVALGELDRAAARAAGVGEQRADTVLRVCGGQARDGDLDVTGGRVRVVLGRLERRALPARCGSIGIWAGAPLQPAGRRACQCRRTRDQQPECRNRGDEHSWYQTATIDHVPSSVGSGHLIGALGDLPSGALPRGHGDETTVLDGGRNSQRLLPTAGDG